MARSNASISAGLLHVPYGPKMILGNAHQLCIAFNRADMLMLAKFENVSDTAYEIGRAHV